MRDPTAQLYQGRDWTSYRWTVAEALETLDHIHDLSLCQGWSEEPELADWTQSLIPDLIGLYEELACQMRLVYADILAPNDHVPSFPQKWISLEIDELMHQLSMKIETLWSTEATPAFSGLVMLTSTIKTLVRRLDQ